MKGKSRMARARPRSLSAALQMLIELLEADDEGKPTCRWVQDEEVARQVSIAKAVLESHSDRLAARAVGCSVAYYRKILKVQQQ